MHEKVDRRSIASESYILLVFFSLFDTPYSTLFPSSNNVIYGVRICGVGFPLNCTARRGHIEECG